MDLTIDDLTFDHIINVIVAHTGIGFNQMIEKTRKREICEARQKAMFFIKLECGKRFSLKFIGEKFGNRDHSLVAKSCKTIKNLYQTDSMFRTKMDKICEDINPALKSKLEAIKK